MDDTILAAHFDTQRSHLRAVAYRMLGSTSEADDAVQEAWIKAARADRTGIENVGGWLTTIVSRVCLDLLRARKSRPAANDSFAAVAAPESDLAIVDELGPALQVVLAMLSPAERVAFVLHDLFDQPFEAIAPIIDRSLPATRQLASRARRRVRSGTAAGPHHGPQRELVSAFLAASRDGDLDGLVALLAADVVMAADELSVQTAIARASMGAPTLAPELRGPAPVAEAFKGRARAAKFALINGDPGAVWVMGGQVRAAFVFTVANDANGTAIDGLDIIMDPADLEEFVVEIIGD